MAEKLVSSTFRSAFRAVEADCLRWFPGHMGKGMKQMQHKLRQVDCLIEVHDARIPLSGRNPMFKHTLGGIKPHVLVLNKVDLIPKGAIKKIEEAVRKDCSNVLFTNSKAQRCGGVRKLLPLVNELISNSDRYNRSEAEDYSVMIIGIPNVGKSSLINRLRVRHLSKGNASPVGANPGITRSLMTKIKISEKPLCYMFDTPGILSPHIADVESGLKLALCNTIQDHLVGEEVIADYLLYWLNKQERFGYVDHFRLDRAADDITEVLTKIAINNNKLLKFKDTTNNYVVRPDFLLAAKHMIKAFRNGELGKIVLDDDLL